MRCSLTASGGVASRRDASRKPPMACKQQAVAQMSAYIIKAVTIQLS